MSAHQASLSRSLVCGATGIQSLAPFLYFTRTISTGHQRSRKTSHREHSRHQPADRTGARHPLGEQNKRREQSEKTTQRTKFSSIPFERLPARQDPYAELELQGSTITPNERKAFENLFNLTPKPKVLQSKDGRASPLPKGPDALLSSTSEANAADRRRTPELPLALKGLLQDIRAANSGDEVEVDSTAASVTTHGPQAPPMSAAASKYLQHVSKAMEASETDTQIWEILHTRVLDRVETSLEDEKMVQTLAQHLTKTLERLASHFPSSPLPLSILPALKALGHTAVAIGASTKLYNLHMRLLYERYIDLPAIVDILNEMHTGNHEADEETLELLDDILIFARQAEQGECGAGTKMLWQMDRLQGPLVRIAERRKDLVRKREERALKRVRQRDFTESEAEIELNP